MTISLNSDGCDIESNEHPIKIFWKMKERKETGLQWLWKLIYALCYIVLWVILVTKLYACVERFMIGSTYYESEVVKQQHTLFPELTLCSGNRVGLKRDFKKIQKVNKYENKIDNNDKFRKHFI